MDRLIATNTVPFAFADRAPGAGTPGYATNGNPSAGLPATVWPAYEFNAIQDEIMNVIVAAGITPDGNNWTQLLEALTILFGAGTFSVANPGWLDLPLGFILNFGSQNVVAGSTATLGGSGYAKPYTALPLLSWSNPGGTSTAGAFPGNLNVRNSGATITAGTITNPNSFTIAYDWGVIGR